MKIITVKAEDRLDNLRDDVKNEYRFFIGKYDTKKPVWAKKDKSYRWIVLTDVFIYLENGPVFLDHINLMIKDIKTLTSIKKEDLIIGSSMLKYYTRKDGTISCGFSPMKLQFQKADKEYQETYSKLFYDLYYT